MYFSLVAIVVFVFVVVSLLFLSYFARLSHTVVATNCDFGISSLCFFLFFNEPQVLSSKLETSYRFIAQIPQI